MKGNKIGALVQISMVVSANQNFGVWQKMCGEANGKAACRREGNAKHVCWPDPRQPGRVGASRSAVACASLRRQGRDGIGGVAAAATGP